MNQPPLPIKKQWQSKPFQPVLSRPYPSLSRSFLPDCVRDIVYATAQALEVPIELPLSCCLGVASCVCQGRWSVVIKPDWIEATSLFIATPADPGERKTPTLRIFSKPLMDWERHHREQCQKKNLETETKEALIEKQIKQLERSSGESANLESIAKQIDTLREQIPPKMTPPRLFTDDTSPERLLRIMAEHQGCMAILTDEGGAFLQQIAGRYSGGMSNLDGVLKGWDNGPIRVDRSNGNDVFLDHGRLTLLLLIQKSVAIDALKNRDFMGRGLVHRCLWLLPTNDHIGNRSGDGPPVPDRLKADWCAQIEGLLSWSPAEAGASGTKTHLIQMDLHARESLFRHAAAIEEQIRQLDEADPRRTYRQKWPGQVARLAGVIHCIEASDTGNAPHAVQIAHSTMQSALALAVVLLDQADAALDLLGQDPLHERMRRILKRVDAEGEMTVANLWRKLRQVTSLFSNKEQFDGAIGQLVNNGYLAYRFEGKTEHVRLTEDAIETLPGPNRAHRGHVPRDRHSPTPKGS